MDRSGKSAQHLDPRKLSLGDRSYESPINSMINQSSKIVYENDRNLVDSMKVETECIAR
jgi:hypothetical protein